MAQCDRLKDELDDLHTSTEKKLRDARRSTMFGSVSPSLRDDADKPDVSCVC